MRDAQVLFRDAAIDALVLCEGAVLRTAAPDATHYGVAQVRREVTTGPLALTHVVFAPDGDRPLLLSVVRLENAGDVTLGVEYTETWNVSGGAYRARDAACERAGATGAGGIRALAEASAVLRARPPEPAPRVGLALDVPLALPPHSRRQLTFAYVEAEDPAELVRAWRGDVEHELQRTVSQWLARLGAASGARTPEEVLAAYRAQVLRNGSGS